MLVNSVDANTASGFLNAFKDLIYAVFDPSIGLFLGFQGS